MNISNISFCSNNIKHNKQQNKSINSTICVHNPKEYTDFDFLIDRFDAEFEDEYYIKQRKIAAQRRLTRAQKREQRRIEVFYERLLALIAVFFAATCIVSQTVSSKEMTNNDSEVDYFISQEDTKNSLQPSIEINSYDDTEDLEPLYEPDFIEAFNSNENFAQYKLNNMGKTIMEICEEFDGVDPYLIAAIIASETKWGAKIDEHNNPAGIMDPKTNWSKLKYFNSLEDGLRFFIKTIYNDYLSQGYTTISQIGEKYCPVDIEYDYDDLNSNWVPNVTSIYNQLSDRQISPDTDLSQYMCEENFD